MCKKKRVSYQIVKNEKKKSTMMDTEKRYKSKTFSMHLVILRAKLYQLHG